ncbi:hypothetical protein K492DRAFT_189871 [Lichtheimia hyalospora FSU 10163]|nr:hypothetical protein K492DRAFT_189871 [Lichtheimia hyalospora FSU 10163]
MVRRQHAPTSSSSNTTLNTNDNPSSSPDEIRFIHHLSTKYKRAPVRFRIEPAPQYCDEQGRLICSPGSYIEGNIYIELAEPLAAMQLKLIYKGIEYLNYDAMAWGKRVDEDPLFSVCTVLWGISPREAQQSGNWPLMEPGTHLFPFACQMPDINYPSAWLDNPLVQCRFHLIASIERPGYRPFQTEPCPVFFKPTLPIDISTTTPFEDDKPIGSIPIRVSFNTAYVCNDDDANAVNISCGTTRGDYHIVATATLEQHYKVVTSGFHYSKTIVVRQVEQRIDTDNHVISMPLRDLPPSMNYGRQVDLRYMIRLMIKSRQGSTLHPSKKKRSYLVPITLGTVDADINRVSPPVPYSDPDVVNDTTLHTKPKFMRVAVTDAAMLGLPAYDAENSPPEYCEEQQPS